MNVDFESFNVLISKYILYSTDQQLNIFSKLTPTTSIIEFINLIKSADDADATILTSLEESAIKDKPTLSSIEKGNIGEYATIRLLEPIFPKCNIVNVGKVAHSCDIDITDETLKIKYAIEVKNKKVILMDDITKFESDIARLRDLYKDSYVVIGLFLSFNSDKIPTKGDICFDNWCLYLTQRTINLETIKCFVEVSKSTRPCIVQTLKPMQSEIIKCLSPDIIETLTKLKTDYLVLKSINDSLQIIVKNSNESYIQAMNVITNNNKLIASIEILSETIKKNYEINPIDTHLLHDTHGLSEELYNYIKSKPKKSTLKALKIKFPLEESLITREIVDKVRSNTN